MTISSYPLAFKALKAANPSLAANGGFGDIALKSSSACFIESLNKVRVDNNMEPVDINAFILSAISETESKLSPKEEVKPKTWTRSLQDKVILK
tara:strand:+ start:816 stop:1097 length:282 start_codon:yes stop_codon:yes gene_type:complete